MVLASSTVMVPSLPTFSIASAMIWPMVLSQLAETVATCAISELSFTFYVDVYGFFNLLGHFFKVAAFYFFYKAIIKTGLVTPYNLLFRDLKQSEEALRRTHDELEVRVQERTAELTRAYESLKAEVFARQRMEEALRDSERKYSQVEENSLTGIFINQDGRVVFCNQRFAEMLRAPLNRIIGSSFREIMPSDEWREFKALLDTCGIEGCRGEYHLNTFEGGVEPVYMSAGFRRCTVGPSAAWITLHMGTGGAGHGSVGEAGWAKDAAVGAR